MQDVLTNKPNHPILNRLVLNRLVLDRWLRQLDRFLSNRLSSHQSPSNNLRVVIKLHSRVSVQLRLHRRRFDNRHKVLSPA